MQRRQKVAQVKPLAPFWLYFRLIGLLIFLASAYWLYQDQSRWLIALPILLLSLFMLLFAPTRLRGWLLVIMSFIRYTVLFFGLTYAAFVVLDVRQGIALEEALLAPYRLAALVYQPTMPFSGILLGLIIFFLLLLALRNRKKK